MKKKSIILLVVLVIVAIIISVASIFVVKNWNKLYTMYYVLTGRSDELEQKYARDEEKLKETIKDMGIDGMRPLTEEESEKLNKGEISEEEAINLILGRDEETSSDSQLDSTGENNETSSSEEKKEINNDKEPAMKENINSSSGNKDKKEQAVESDKKINEPKNDSSEKATQTKDNNKKGSSSDKSSEKKPSQSKEKDKIEQQPQVNDEKKEEQPQVNDEKKEEQTPEYTEKNAEISQLIGELYVLKSQFSADLSAIEDWVNSQYRVFCEEYGGPENIPSSAKTKVGKRAYEKALALEDACDVKVNEILSKVKILLKETNQSVSIVDEIKASYENEKSKAISYYMSQF